MFAPPVSYPADDRPISVAIGDIVGDQAPDLAVASALGGGVSVLLGVGDGTFADAVLYATGRLPMSAAIGDLDCDQIPDLVATDLMNNVVSWLRGQGDGTFAAGGTYPAGEAPQSVTIDDLNSDGAPDLAVANSLGRRVSVLLNLRPWVGDLNCDGEVNGDDIAPFVLAMANLPLYQQSYPGCPFRNRDINGDGLFDFGDINPFVDLMVRSGQAPIMCGN